MFLRKKKKKKTFDLDAVLPFDLDDTKKEENIEEPSGEAAANDFDDNLDLESFGKKKKKKKKPFNLEEIENALPKENIERVNEPSAEPEDDDINLDMDFSMAKKKKKIRKKEIDELIADKKEEEDKSEDKENGMTIKEIRIRCSF